MNDKKASDDDFFEDDFNEDINFDEENFDAPDNVKPSAPSGGGGIGKGPSKKQIFAVLILSVFITLGYYGYKFYSTEKPKTESLPLIAQVPVKPAAKPEEKPVTKAEVKPETKAEVKPTPTKTVTAPTVVSPAESVTTDATTAINATKTSSTTPSSPPPSKGEPPKAPAFEDKDLEKFLSTAASTKPLDTKTPPVTGGTSAAVTTPLPEPTLTSPEKSATIQEMQKDLFAEKPLIKEIKPSEMAKAPLIPPATPPSIENQQVKQIKDQTKEAMEALARLNQQMESNLSQIKSLDAYTRDVSQTVAKLNSDISAMDNRLLALTNAATSLSKDIGSVRNEAGTVRRAPREDLLDVSTAPRRRVEAPTITVEEPEYVVHAVIPGRAWIKSTKGQILTVSEGDSLGNYGKVLVIDATNGVVLTSSGVALR